MEFEHADCRDFSRVRTAKAVGPKDASCSQTTQAIPNGAKLTTDLQTSQSLSGSHARGKGDARNESGAKGAAPNEETLAAADSRRG
jgi:hypothetical protein